MADLVQDDVQRLMELLEKILDESDGFPPDPRLEDIISARYFSSLGDQDRLPLLSDDSVNRVTRYHSRVRAKQPRARVDAPVENETIDYEVIVRYFRILERSMREAEHLVVFPTDKKIANTTSNGKSARAKKGKPASKSRSPEDGDRSQTPGKDEHISQEEIAGGQRRLQCANSAVVAALCCLAVFSDENMPKPVSLLSSSRGRQLTVYSCCRKNSLPWRSESSEIRPTILFSVWSTA